jgi:serine/threonine protein kinase
VVENDDMSSQRQLERFRRAVTALQILDPQDFNALLDRLVGEPGLSPIDALANSGLCEPRDVELVQLWMSADSAIPGYELVDLIGRGGMGVVWRARQTSLNRIVALKMISANQGADKTLAARFEREAAAIAKLSHPNIVTALDFGRFDNRLFLVMEYVAGEDLGQYVERFGMISEPTALRLTRQIAAGLSHASRLGVIHRDIKPANILLVDHQDSEVAPQGVPLAKITDFGLALFNQSHQAPEARLTTEHSTLGSPHYMAPDHLNGSAVDTRADVYSLGATLFHLLTGKAPWHGKPLAIIIRDKVAGIFPWDELEAARVSPGTRSLIRRMVASDPSERPSSCQELLVAIDQMIKLQAEASTSGQDADAIISESLADTFAIDRDPHAEALDQDLMPTQPIQQSTSRIQLESPKSQRTGIGSASPSLAKPTLFRTFTGYPMVAGALLLAVLAAVVVWTQRATPYPEPLALTIAGEQESLFDGISIPLDTISEGEISANAGRIELGGTKGSILGFRMPQWEFFKFEATVELPENLILDVAMGNGIASKRRECRAIRFENGQVHDGSLSRIGGEFSSGGNILELDSSRARHYLEIERNREVWVVRVNRDIERQFVLPFADTDPQSLEILFVAQRRAETAGDGATSQVGISELLVSKMRPDN